VDKKHGSVQLFYNDDGDDINDDDFGISSRLQLNEDENHSTIENKYTLLKHNSV
jgi:hypothetical protein